MPCAEKRHSRVEAEEAAGENEVQHLFSSDRTFACSQREREKRSFRFEEECLRGLTMMMQSPMLGLVMQRLKNKHVRPVAAGVESKRKLSEVMVELSE